MTDFVSLFVTSAVLSFLKTAEMSNRAGFYIQ